MISLGIDIGGTGCKCVAFRNDGTQLALAYQEYAVPAGTVNLPPVILSDSVAHVIAQCVAQLPNKEDVRVITVSSFGESFVAVDKDGNALTDILMYFGNTESQAFTDLVEKVGPEKFMRIARILPDACYSLSKMLYTQQVADRPVWKYLFIAGYVCYRLSGKCVADIPLACRSLLYDVERRCWSDELLNASGIEADTLPDAVPAGTEVGSLLPEVAARIGLSPDVRVVIGAHDQIVNALGAGVQNVGEAVDTSGTCECITPLFGDIPEDLDFQNNNFACVPYLEDRGYVTYAYNISAGSVVRWYRDALGQYLRVEAEQKGVSIYDLLNELCPAEPTDLMVLPFLQGMGGTPDVDPHATGLIAGLTTNTRLPDIYRAVLEGVTYEMRYNQEKLEENGVHLKKLYACGGGAKSPAWLQIKADILGCDIIPVKSDETGAMGSAILGLAAVTGEAPFEVAKRFWKYGDPIRPNPDHKAIYDKKYGQYRTLRRIYKEYSQTCGGK